MKKKENSTISMSMKRILEDYSIEEVEISLKSHDSVRSLKKEALELIEKLEKRKVHGQKPSWLG